MGRKPTKNLNLPQRMRARPQKSGVVYYYYDHGGKPRKETPLGKDYVEAVRKWAELERAEMPRATVYTFKAAADRYLRDVVPTKADRTGKDNITQLQFLLKFFNNPPAALDDIRPVHINLYMDWRCQHAREIHAKRHPGKVPPRTIGQVAANREKALFSHVWNKARSWGYTDKENPCAGIEGYPEQGRDVYVDDGAYQALWNAADQPLRDAMDVAWLTGQRPADVLKIMETDIRDGAIWIRQGKTKTKLRVAIEGKLAEVIEDIQSRKRARQVVSLRLLVDDDGHPLSATTLRSQFNRARKASGQQFQFRDLRAKAGTETDMTHNLATAREQLGHSSESMTKRYVRNRAGKLVKPTR